MLFPELVSDVLLRLPVKSLLRFRCLSKSISAEIDSSDFINNHLKRSTETKTHQKLITNEGSSFYAADFDDNLREFTPLSCPLKFPQSGTVVCGDVLNGLILLGIIVKLESRIIRLILWNPFTRRYKNIPIYECTSFSQFSSCSLGYDSTVDDYKIVMILKYFNAEGFSSQLLVFSLKSNSWRRIEDTPLFATGRVASTTGSALYWTCFDDDNMEVKILGFNVANEVLFYIPLLPGFGVHVRRVLDGNLYACRIPDDPKTLEFCLRVSDKDGEEAGGSWRKAFVVHKGELDVDYLNMPLTYSKEGDCILLFNVIRNKLSWYNLEKETRQRIDINVTGIRNFDYDVCSESLVSLGSDTAFDGEAEEVLVDKFNMKT
ncbi:hypothetical protein SLE2022_134110 [Rubroshorea leprosula]